MVSIHLYPERIELAAHDAVVASHARCFERNQTHYDWPHYIPLIERKPGALRNGAPFADLPESLQRLRSLLLKREGGRAVHCSFPGCERELQRVQQEYALQNSSTGAVFQPFSVCEPRQRLSFTISFA